MPTLQVSVNGIAGELCKLTLEARAPLSDLKKRVAAETGINELEQRFFHGTKELALRLPGDMKFLDLLLVRRKPEQAAALGMLETNPRDMVTILTKEKEERHEELCDAEIALAAVQFNWQTMKLLSPELQQHADIVRAALGSGAPASRVITAEHMQDEEMAMEAVCRDGMALQHFGEEVRSHPEIVLHAVEQNAMSLDFASEALFDDRNFFLRALCVDGSLLESATDRLKSDREVVITAVQQDGTALEFAADVLKEDKEVVTAAVMMDGEALQFASDQLKRDEEVVMFAVRQNGQSLGHAHSSMQDNQRISEAAIDADARAFEHASARLKRHWPLVTRAVRRASKGNGLESDRLEDEISMLQEVLSMMPAEIFFMPKPLSFEDDIGVDRAKQLWHERAKEVAGSPALTRKALTSLAAIEGTMVMPPSWVPGGLWESPLADRARRMAHAQHSVVASGKVATATGTATAQAQGHGRFADFVATRMAQLQGTSSAVASSLPAVLPQMAQSKAQIQGSADASSTIAVAPRTLQAQGNALPKQFLSLDFEHLRKERQSALAARMAQVQGSTVACSTAQVQGNMFASGRPQALGAATIHSAQAAYPYPVAWAGGLSLAHAAQPLLRPNASHLTAVPYPSIESL